MNNKKILIVSLAIIIIGAIGFSIYKHYTANLFTPDGKIVDGHQELIDRLKNVQDTESRKNQIDFSLEYNLITQEEANELY